MRPLLLIILCSAVSSLAHATSTINFTHARGPHPVGLRVVQQYDHGRGIERDINAFGESRGGERSRPVQTLIWYPARTVGAPMKAVDYELTKLTDHDFDVPAAELVKTRERWLGGEDGAMLAQPMWATRDAAGASGKYPVVIYAPSFGARAHENADLCEYLASHGYVVLASRSMGPRGVQMSDDVEGIEAQAADIGFLTAFAHSLPQADSSRLAVAGFSWGGLANVFAAARSNRIKALVSLDGSVRSHTQLIPASGSVKPARTAVPMLSIGSRPMSLETLNQKGRSVASSYLNGMKYSDVYLATMQPMLHMNFSSWSLRFDGEAQFVDYSSSEVASAYSWSLRYVKQFLDAYLKQDAAALAFLKNAPVKNGVPAHMMALEVRPASATVPTEESFITAFVGRGFKDAEPIYKAMLVQSPEFSLIPPRLKTWGYQLLERKNAKGAAELFKLATVIHPDYAAVFDSLGEAYEALGENALAITAYEQALALDKRETHAAMRLKALR